MSRPLKWPRIYRRPNASGSKSYVVDGGMIELGDGRKKRERYWFDKKKSAEEKAREMRMKRGQLGPLAAQKQAQASAQLTECLAILTASGIGSLKEAVELGAMAKAGLVPTGTLPTASTATAAPTPTPIVSGESLPEGTKTTEEIIDEYVAARIEAKKGQAETEHEKIMLLVLKKALRPFLGRPIKVIGATEFDQLLAKGTRTRGTRSRWISTLNGLFKYASQPARGYMTHNPADAAVRAVSYEPTGVDANTEKGPVEILSTDQFTSLLRLAESEEQFKPMIMPLAAQGLLGLRRGETRRLPSFQLSNEIREYDVKAKRTRSRQNRDVEVNPTFDLWRKRYWTSDSELYPDNYSELLRKMVSRLKLKWTRNILRHTFASHYLVVHGENATVKQMGHRDSEMLYRHYRRKVSAYEANRYWEIAPLENKDEGGTLADLPGVATMVEELPVTTKRYKSMQM